MAAVRLVWQRYVAVVWPWPKTRNGGGRQRRERRTYYIRGITKRRDCRACEENGLCIAAANGVVTAYLAAECCDVCSRWGSCRFAAEGRRSAADVTISPPCGCMPWLDIIPCSQTKPLLFYCNLRNNVICVVI